MQDLLAIAVAASTLDERLKGKFLPDETQTNDEIINARLNAWCQALAGGDQEQFLRRLTWDGLDEHTVRQIIGPVQMPKGAPLPQWVNTLDEALHLGVVLSENETEGGPVRESHWPFLDPKHPFPFEDILVPFVVVARQRLINQAGNAYHLLNNEAHITLQRDLLQTLTSYAAHALHLEFSIELAQSPLARLLARSQNDDGRTRYQYFVKRMCQGGLANFFREYSVLARLLATVTDLWIEANVEFLQRLAADWSDMQYILSGNGELKKVIAVQPSLSDPHQGRRRVMAVTFASGLKLVYKPKNLGTEKAFYRLLDWCNKQGVRLPLKVLKVIDRSSHGWVEFVEYEPCQEHAEVQCYYQRAGMLLCLVYVLEGTDCHYENLIANREHPVLIDMETLLHPRLQLESEENRAHVQLLVHKQFMNSVLRTGLLPNWRIFNDGRFAYDVSGLGRIGEQEHPVSLPIWKYINTDRMTLERGSVKMRGKSNEPRLKGAVLQMEKHIADVVEGFQQMYHFLLENRGTLLTGESPLYELAHQQVRFIHRSTRIYNALTQRLLDPKYLRDGIERSIQLELLGRAFLPLEGPLCNEEEQTRWWPVFVAERQAIEQGDVPFFTTYANSNALMVTSDQEIKACFESPSFDLVTARLKAMDNNDLQQQSAFIQGSLFARFAHTLSNVQVAKSEKVDADFHTADKATAEGLVTQALAIAQQIAARAIRARDGSAAWIGLQYLTHAERYQFQPLGYDLYGGACGIALFLSALERVTGGAGYRELALGALQPLRQGLRDHGNRIARDMGIGGASGLGSVIYTLIRISQWLDEPALVEDARRAAMLITAERIANDTALDIITGAAGAMLGLLTLYELGAEQSVLERALACGQHLLQARVESKTGYRAWPTLGRRLLTGFSHGAAGISHALLRLYAITCNENLLAAAREAIAYEDSVFVSEAGNWPDFRAEEQPAFMMSWCHGAPGIGLARIAGLPVIDTYRIREDIEVALMTTLQFGVRSPDHLCCGNLGRADILLIAAHRLARPELAALANRQAWQVVTKAAKAGTFILHPLLPLEVYNPGFFQGTAGIGYTLLRLAQPNALPSILLWE